MFGIVPDTESVQYPKLLGNEKVPADDVRT
jgi:hypothetical protein